MNENENERPSSNRWMYASIPANIASGPLGTLIPLYILTVGGGVFDVAIAITAYNVITIPSAFLWGHVSDSIKRKTLIIFSYIFTTALLFLLLYEKAIIDIAITYGLIAFVNSANGTPLNLMVMETNIKENWARGFSALQTFSAVGYVIGLVLGVVVTVFTGMTTLISLLAIISLGSVLLATVLIREPSSSPMFSRTYFTEVKSLVRELVVQPIELAMLPIHSLRELARARSINVTRHGKGYIYTIYVATLLFYIGTSVYGAEYAAGLNLHGLSTYLVFAIILAGGIAQTITFRYSYKFIKAGHKNPLPAGVVSLRGISFALMGVSFMFLTGALFFYSNVLLCLIASGFSYAIFYTGSYALLFNTLKGKNSGSSLGIYSAVAGVGNLVGSLLSGVIALYLGLDAVFIIAGLLVVASAYGFSLL